MGEVNTAEEKINTGSGAAGQVKVSQGANLPPVFGMPRFTLNKLLKGAGVGADPTEIDVPIGNTIIASGSYTGNDTANRAIAHGLGVVPKIVYLFDLTNRLFGKQHPNSARIWAEYGWNASENTDGAITSRWYTQTAMDVTNFYVGNALWYVASFNSSGTTYYWIAMS